MKLFSRADRSFLAQWWWTIDRPLLSIILALTGFGIVLVTTASPTVASHLGLNDYHFLKRHIIILIPAFVMMLGISMLAERQIWRLSVLLFTGTLLALLLVLWTGVEIKGARRWVHVLGFSLQPSEFLKPSLAILGAWFISKQKETDNNSYTNYIIAGFFYTISIILLLMQPDLGMTVIVFSILATQIFMAGLPFRHIFGLIGVGAVGIFMAYLTLPHVESRINRYLDPSSGDSYQIDRAIQAFQNGGLFGTGLGEGETKLLLPDAHADFIFAVAGEELGLVFSLIILGLFFSLIIRGFHKLAATDSLFRVIAAGSILTMLGLQSIVHIGSSLHLLPTKGMTLPFISYGGSSLLSVFISTGFALALLRKNIRSSVSKGGIVKITKRNVFTPSQVSNP